MSTQTLLEQIEAFMARSGMSASQFGQQAMNDKTFVGKLRDGRKVRLDTAEKIQAFMRAHRPRSARTKSPPIARQAS